MATARRVARLLEKQGAGELEDLSAALDDVRAAARELVDDGVRSDPASRTSGPW
jgi:hypothetical protein